MLSTLGKVNWAVRPSAGALPFLSGAYQAVQRAAGGMVDLSGTAVRGVGTAIMPAHIPRHFPNAKTEGFVFLSDAAERPKHRGRFRVGLVGLTETYKSFKCPTWIRILPQAELWGVYLAMKIANYIHRNVTRGRRGAGFRAGTDSGVAKHEVVEGHASLGCIFWLRCWSRCSVGIFRVPSP